MPELTVVSLNLRGIHDCWRRRAPLVAAGLAALNPDVICLQEAATWRLQARELAGRLSRRTGRRYHVARARKGGYRGACEGLAILSVFPFEARGRLVIGEQGRVAQRAVVRVDGVPLTVANTHLEHRGERAGERLAQARRVTSWLRDAGPVVLCGDLNDLPESATLADFRERFRSAHEDAGVAVSGTAPAWESGRVIDYILVGGGLQAVDAGTCLDAPVGGTWPSDHIGLWARVSI